MYSPRKHRLLSALLLAAYVLATSASALWHHHGDSSSCGAAHCGHAHACASTAPAAPAASDDAPRIAAAHSADDCAICRFQGQRTIASPAPALAATGEVCVPAIEVRRTSPSAPLASEQHSRAPPRAA